MKTHSDKALDVNVIRRRINCSASDFNCVIMVSQRTYKSCQTWRHIILPLKLYWTTHTLILLSEVYRATHTCILLPKFYRATHTWILFPILEPHTLFFAWDFIEYIHIYICMKCGSAMYTSISLNFYLTYTFSTDSDTLQNYSFRSIRGNHMTDSLAKEQSREVTTFFITLHSQKKNENNPALNLWGLVDPKVVDP